MAVMVVLAMTAEVLVMMAENGGIGDCGKLKCCWL